MKNTHYQVLAVANTIDLPLNLACMLLVQNDLDIRWDQKLNKFLGMNIAPM
jgi:hypothetical protein